MSRPLLALAAAFGAGCLVGGEGGARSALGLAVLGAVLLVLSLAAPGRRAAAGALVAAAVGLGAADATVERLAYDEAPLRSIAEARAAGGGPVVLEATARGDAQVFPDRVLLVLDVAPPATGGLRVDLGGRTKAPEILDGDRLRLWAALRPVSGFRTPGAFDAPAAAFHEGVHALGYCKSARLVDVLAPGRGPGAVAAGLRQRARAALARFVLPGPEEGLVRAMTLGDRTGIDDATAEAFRAAGTYHVLALSGAQVALVAALLVGGLRAVGAGPATQGLVAIATVSFYALLVGGDVPIVRAALMAGAVLLGRALELDADTANLLGLAALLLLAYRPSNVTDVGFQLSFAATLGILLLTPPLVAGLPRLPLRVELLVAASTAAQAVLLPFLAAHFHRATLAGILLNLAAVPLSSAVLLLGLAVLGAAAVAPVLAPWLGDGAWIAAHALRRSSELSGLAGGLLDGRVGPPSFLALAAWAAGLIRLRQGRRVMGLGLLGIMQILPVLEPDPPGDGRLHLSVLDVGQGDALVVRSPRGRTYVIDAGGSPRGRFDTGERVVGPFLWTEGVRRIETVVVSHAHPDHAGGVPFLLRAFRVGAVWEGPAPRRDESYRWLDESLARSGGARRTVVRGARDDWDGVELTVLGPHPLRPPWRVRNDDSLVLALRLGEVRFLLTGDVEASAERELLRSSREGLAATVVKVPHHGSGGSSGTAFVEAVRPTIAVVSVGGHNPFGHPHPDALARYRRAGALVYRTDRDGTVTLSTDGRRLWVRMEGEAVERRLR